MKKGQLSRRKFLRLSAMAAGGAMLTACGGTTAPTSAPQGGATSPAGGPTAAGVSTAAGVPTSAPTSAVGAPTIAATAMPAGTTQYKQAPALAALVQQGKLPPVNERLPKDPYVVPHKWVKPGKYGGTMRWTSDASWGLAHFVQESLYGHSILRWLDDGLTLAPGLAHEWAPNADLSEWTFNFREGLKWSDGSPWTTADIMYWWEDMVLNEEHSASPPDEAKSSNGQPMQLTAPDGLTLVMKFDAPAPLTPFHLARWVNVGIGPDWMRPKHYLQQFHPKYNPKFKGKKDWMTLHDQKMDFAQNPECPAMTGWKAKSFREGQNSVWERNPYYWCVDKEGHQLPYMDQIFVTGAQDAQIQKLSLMQGKADFAFFNPITLADVAELKAAQSKSKLEVLLWDGGSGTGSLFFFNYDFAEPKMRELIRNPKLRQALSYAFNREQVRKVVYFNTGELTTGTYSPKALDFLANDEAKRVYTEWRDSYVTYDPARAKQLLDSIGVKDVNGDGFRELPGGGKLLVMLDYPADTSTEHISKNNLLAKDWKAVGINTRLNPIAPTGYEDLWVAGKVMSKTAWENSGGIHEMLVEPQVLVPLGGFPEWWSPLQANYHAIRGTAQARAVQGKDPYKRNPPSMQPEKGGPIERMWQLHDRSKTEIDPIKRYGLVWDIIKIHVSDGPFFMGPVANTPRPVLVNEGMRNVPRMEDLRLHGFANPWSHPTPAVYDPETWYWEDPEQHS